MGRSAWEGDGGVGLKFPAPESAASRRQRSRQGQRKESGWGAGRAELWGGWTVKRRQGRVGETESEQQERKTDLAVTVGRDRSRELTRKRPMRRSLCKSRQDVMRVLAAEKNYKEQTLGEKKILSKARYEDIQEKRT